MGYDIANASMDMAMGGFTGIGAIGSIQDAITITRTIRSAMISLNVSFDLGKKRGGSAGTPGRQIIQVRPHAAHEPGFCAGHKKRISAALPEAGGDRFCVDSVQGAAIPRRKSAFG